MVEKPASAWILQMLIKILEYLKSWDIYNKYLEVFDF